MVSFDTTNLKPQLIGGALSALLFIILQPLLSDFTLLFAQIPLFFIALQFEFLVLCLPVALAGILVFLFGEMQEVLKYFLFIVVPVSILSRQALLNRQDANGKLKWYPEGRLLAVLGMLGFVYVALFSWLENKIEISSKLQQAFQELQSQMPLDKRTQTEQLQTFLQALVPYFPGMAAIAYLLMTFGAGAIAQKQLIKTNKLKRPPLSLKDVYLPWWCWYGLIIGGLGWLVLPTASLYQSFAANITLVLMFVFLLQGLSIVHHYVKMQGYSQLFLVIFYAVVIMFTWPIFIFIILGVLEPWLRLRERLSSN